MNTDGPVPVYVGLGKIEDELAEAQDRHSKLAGQVRRGEKFFKAYAANLAKMAEETSADKKSQVAWSIIHESQEYADHLELVEEYEALETRLEYWKARATIGQSILKAMTLEGQLGGRYGQQERGQAGTPEPR